MGSGCCKSDAAAPVHMKSISSHPGNGVWLDQTGTKEVTIVDCKIIRWSFPMPNDMSSNRLTQDVFNYPPLSINSDFASFIYDTQTDTWIQVEQPSTNKKALEGVKALAVVMGNMK